jgi:DNA-directed RNA polymerase specialized sigma24 family protein/ribosome-associated translation inhibitor RaiA
MKTQIRFHNLEKTSHEGLEDTIHELARGHVGRYLSRFPSDTVALHVHVEKSRHRNYYRIGTQLAVPGGTLISRQEGYDLMGALRKAFDELEHELLRHISRLRQDDAWHRKERREELRRLTKTIEARPETGAEAFGDQVRALLPQLQNFVQRDVSALRARGDLNPDYPTPQDIVDDVLALAYERFGERPKDIDLLHWLYQLTHEVLNDETRKNLREEGRFSLVSKPPRPRDHTLDEQDQGAFEFWKPDEMLSIDNVLPVLEDTPEDKVGEEELRKYFHDVLAKMPNNWRRAIWLAQAEAIPVGRAARMMGASEDEVKRWIQQGDEYLRAQLREAGYKPAEEEGKLPAYFVRTRAAATPELTQALDDVTKGTQ